MPNAPPHLKRILVLQAGRTDQAVSARLGDHPDWFARALAGRALIQVARAFEGELPPTDGYHGVIMTGSPASATAPQPWMDVAAAYLLRASRDVPVLGVCFGHQLLARALGGEARRSARWREVGSTEVRLTREGRADPLFRGLPDRFHAQQTHEDEASLPPDATLLAENDHCAVQAYAYGDRVRCVQFHPEMTAQHSRLLAEARRSRLDATVPGGADAVLASLRETPEAARVLVNWVEVFVGA